MISRNEALDLLWECQQISVYDPEIAHLCADSVLREVIDDEEISAEFLLIPGHYKPLP